MGYMMEHKVRSTENCKGCSTNRWPTACSAAGLWRFEFYTWRRRRGERLLPAANSNRSPLSSTKSRSRVSDNTVVGNSFARLVRSNRSE